MSDAEFEAFFEARQRAARDYVRGDGGTIDAIVPHEGGATFFSPRGDVVSGARDVALRYGEDAKAFKPNGTTRLEVLQQASSGDLAFWTGYQLAKAQIGSMPRAQDMKIRVTEVFRKIDGSWKLVHRHADMP